MEMNETGGLFARKPKETIRSFETIVLSISGMRGTQVYEALMKSGKAEVTLYEMRYNSGRETKEKLQQGTAQEEAFVKLLNDCGILSWDGFDGPHPKGVLDGRMFVFDAVVNDSQKIHATGSENFPKHFREFEAGLNAILSGKN